MKCCWRIWFFLCCLCWLPLAQANSCEADIVQVSAALSAAELPAEVTQWQDISLPDNWSQRWPQHSGVAWYRISWQAPCAAPNTSMALYVDAISMAGAIYAEEQLLWRDAHLQEPLSRSWNRPRMLTLPPSTPNQATQHLYVRVSGDALNSPGMGALRIADVDTISALQQDRQWQHRTLFLINAILSASLGLFCACIWLLRRQETALGWYMLASLTWLAFLYNLLATETAPFPNAKVFMQAHISAFVLYTLCFCTFTWRFIQHEAPRLQLLLRTFCVLALLGIWGVPAPLQAAALAWAFFGSVLILSINSVLVTVWGWRSHELTSRLLALTMLACISLGLLSLLAYLRVFTLPSNLVAYTSLLLTVFMALILAMRLTQSLQRIEAFHHELGNKIRETELNLTASLAEQHSAAVKQMQTQERTHLAHDLHDGLGGALIRSIMVLEQADEPVDNAKNLSILKLLRSDLRQIIDQFSAEAANIPTTPVVWLAPLRHRYVQLCESMDMNVSWEVAKTWHTPPQAPHCLTLYRVIEEALTNVIKHSAARQVKVRFYCDVQHLYLLIEDDGVGFDVAASQQSGISIGMNSMRTRVNRLHGQLTLHSEAGCTRLEVSVPLTLTNH